MPGRLPGPPGLIVEPGARSIEQEESTTMTTMAMSKWRAALNISLLDDLTRANLVTSIQKVAAQSALIQVPARAARGAAINTKGGAFATNVATTATFEKQLRASTTARDVSRATLDLELVTLKSLVENNATSASDITAMGFVLLESAKPSKTPPSPPEALLVRPGREHGKSRVAVQGKGYLGHFAAQVSTDPIGATTWTSLPGTGKERQLAGYASGTKLWVQFAAVRWGLQSAWCTPVMIIIP
jgi:hypothetical protein